MDEGVDEADALGTLHEVNVLPIDDVLGNPFPPISLRVKQMQSGELIVLRHHWEPQPLYDIWLKLGIAWFACRVHEHEWQVFIHKPLTHPRPDPSPVIAVELRHVAEGEAVPRVVVMFEQLGAGQQLEITGASPPVEAEVRRALDTHWNDRYTWHQMHIAPGKSVIRVAARSVA